MNSDNGAPEPLHGKDAYQLSAADRVRSEQAGDPILAKHAASVLKSLALDQMVDRFLAWPLPDSVRSDTCVTMVGGDLYRSGTNLLTADEARAMFEYVLNEAGRAVPEPVATAEANVGNSTEPAPASPIPYPCPLTRQDLNDAMDQAECSVYDQIKDEGEREYVMDGLRKIRKLVQAALDAPVPALPIRCEVCTNAMTQGNVDDCGSPACPYKNRRSQ